MRKFKLVAFFMLFVSLFLLSGTLFAFEKSDQPQFYFLNEYPEEMEFLWAYVGTPEENSYYNTLPIEIIAYNHSPKALEFVYLNYFFYYIEENKLMDAYDFIGSIANDLWLPYSSTYKASEIYYYHQGMPDYIFVYPNFIQPYKESPYGTSRESAIDFISSVLNVDALALLEEEDLGLSNSLQTESDVKNPIATIKMKNGDVIKVELYPDVAPNTVNNFIYLANWGFYDESIFHRVIKDFIIQGGDPYGNGTGGPGYSIKGEFSSNGFTNNLKHTEGVISMARSTDKNSAGSQFFIMMDEYHHLDGEYAAFGKVIEGMDAVYKINNAVTNYYDEPLLPQVIEYIRVETFGIEYPPPSVLLFK